MEISKALIAASSRPLILSILTSGETYGYQIIQRVKELSAGELNWADGMLYPVLHRLEKEGLIESHWKMSEKNRMRKYYNITAAGREAMVLEKRQWLAVDSALVRLWGRSAME